MSLRRTVACVSATLLIASVAGASPWVLKPGEFYSDLSGSFYSASSFYQGDERFSLGGRLDQREVLSRNEFGWKPRASVWIALPFVSRGFSRFSGGTSTSTGLGDIDLGVRFRLKGGETPAALSLGWTASTGVNRKLFPGSDGEGGTDPGSYPPASPSNASDTSLYFNQGLQSLALGLDFGGHAWKHAFWTAGGKYTYRYLEFLTSGGDSHNARFVGANATLGWWIRPSLLVTGAFDGDWVTEESANYDRRLKLDLEPSRMLAGARFTYRVDDRMDVFAGSNHVFSGDEVLHYDQFYCGIAWKHTSLSRYAGAYGGTSESAPAPAAGAGRSK